MFIFAALYCLIIVDAGAQTQEKTQEKSDIFVAAELASAHCRQIEEIIKQPHSLYMHYGAIRTDVDLADFSFLIAEYQTLISRRNKEKFNALMGLEVVKKIALSGEQYPFAGNCEITDLQPSRGKAALKTIIAFGTEQKEIAYKLVKPQGYAWQIDDVIIANQSLAGMYRTEFRQNISFYGFDKFIENLCNSSSFSKLGCK